MIITNETPIAMLTVGQLKEILFGSDFKEFTKDKSKKYAYGIAGIQSIFNCSRATANRIKSSGKIDAAINQVGRKIIIDVDFALQLFTKDAA